MSGLEEYTSAQLSIIQALIDGRKRFSELEDETDYNAHWLNDSLNELQTREPPVIAKIADKAGYELDSEWKKENDWLVRLLARTKAKINFMRADIDSDGGWPMGLALLPAFYYPPACMALYYHKNWLYKFLKSQATRALAKSFDSAMEKLKKSELEFLKEVKEMTALPGLPGLDLDKMTFDQCMKKFFRPADQEIAIMERETKQSRPKK